MKKSLILIVFIIFSFCFGACGTVNTANNNGDKNEIIYSTDFGTKIENFSEAKQAEVSNYVADCKVLFVNEYKEKIETHNHISKPFVDFTDVFVYDFENIIETTLDDNSLLLWELIKEVRNNEAKPLMYVQINGYCQYFSDDYIATQLGVTGISNGFFIYNDSTVVQLRYDQVASRVYVYELPKGTTIINCGDKYSQKNTSSDIENFNGKLKILNVIN